jgi:hypothetical protein
MDAKSIHFFTCRTNQSINHAAAGVASTVVTSFDFPFRKVLDAQASDAWPYNDLSVTDFAKEFAHTTSSAAGPSKAFAPRPMTVCAAPFKNLPSINKLAPGNKASPTSFAPLDNTFEFSVAI